jgi:MFS transporter (putative signal transducer)
MDMAPVAARLGLPSERASWVKLGIIAGLIMGQTLPGVLLYTAIPAILRKDGMALEMLWVLQLSTIPWWMKWLWAPFIDRHGLHRFGFRKSWIIPCAALALVIYGAISLTTPSTDNLMMLVGLLFIRVCVVATLDIAVDGFTIENLSGSERIYGASIFDIGNIMIGVIAIAGLMSFYEVYGWTLTIVVAAGVFILLHVPVLFYREPPRPRAAIALAQRGQKPSILRFLRRKDGRILGLISFAAGFATQFLNGVMSPFLIDRSFSVGDVGVVMGIGGLLGFPIGSMLAASLASRLGFKAALRASLFLLPLMPAPLYLLHSVSDPSRMALTIGCYAALTFIIAVPSIVFTSARFAWTSQSQASTDFTIQSSLYGVGSALSVSLAGVVAGKLGYSIFMATGLVIWTVAVVVYYVTIDRVAAIIEARRVEEERLQTESLAA